MQDTSGPQPSKESEWKLDEVQPNVGLNEEIIGHKVGLVGLSCHCLRMPTYV